MRSVTISAEIFASFIRRAWFQWREPTKIGVSKGTILDGSRRS